MRDVVDKLFDHVANTDPATMRLIERTIRPHRLTSIKNILCKHIAKTVPSLQPINARPDAVGAFLLEYCRLARRQFPQPGDPLGIQLTCRITNRYTQQMLDVRHLKDANSFAKTARISRRVRNMNAQIHIFTSFRQIIEIVKKTPYMQMLVRGDARELNARLLESCVIDGNKGKLPDGSDVYLNAVKFIVVDSFVQGVSRVLYCGKKNLDYLFRRIPMSDIIALSDVWFVNEKCGVTCFFFNFLEMIKFQFFKKSGVLESREEHDVINVVRFQCSSGQPLPLNRNGLKKNENRSPLEKLCFEAVKQNLVDESIRNRRCAVTDSTSKMFFGQRFNEGTGFDDFIPHLTN